MNPTRKAPPVCHGRRKALITLSLTPLAAFANQDYPSRPVTVVVPAAAGGGIDIAARFVMQRLGAELKQSFVVDNRGGAGGNIGAGAVAKAQADGYTLLYCAQSPITIAGQLQPKPSFNPETAFIPISINLETDVIILVNPGLPIKSLADLKSYSNANPGKVYFGSSGIGNETHLLLELVKKTVGVRMDHVPYKGLGPAMLDLVSNQIQVLAVSPGQAKSYLNSGQARAIALLSEQRNPEFPDVPTAKESGYPDLVQYYWFGLFAPAGTPAEVVNRLSAAIQAINKDTTYQATLAKQLFLRIRDGSQKDAVATAASSRRTWERLLKTIPELSSN